jgi:hypothetical protein
MRFAGFFGTGGYAPTGEIDQIDRKGTSPLRNANTEGRFAMQLKVLVTALVAGVALLMAGAASAQGLLDGDFFAIDDKNPRIASETEVLFPANDNDVQVLAKCRASTGEEVGFVIDAFERPSKTTITETKATIDKNRKEEPAAVWGILAGICSIAGTPCIFDEIDFTDCPGVETCNSAAELLNCEQAKVKSTVNTKNDNINWSAQAKKCLTVSAPLLAAVDNACGRAGDNKGISLNVRENEIRNLRINGRSKDAIVLP